MKPNRPFGLSNMFMISLFFPFWTFVTYRICSWRKIGKICILSVIVNRFFFFGGGGGGKIKFSYLEFLNKFIFKKYFKLFKRKKKKETLDPWCATKKLGNRRKTDNSVCGFGHDCIFKFPCMNTNKLTKAFGQAIATDSPAPQKNVYRKEVCSPGPPLTTFRVLSLESDSPRT